jgi:hypothetical protein
VARRPIPYLYVAMPSGFARDPAFTLEEKGLMMVLMEWARPTDGKYTVWPGVDTIAKRCNESPRTIQRALAGMEKKGHITRTRRGGKSSVTVLVCMDKYRSDSISGELPHIGMSNPPTAPHVPEEPEEPIVDVEEEEIVQEPTPREDDDDVSLVVGQDSPRNQMSAPLPAGVTVMEDRPARRSRSSSTKRRTTSAKKTESSRPSSAAVAVANAFTARMK